MPKKRHNHYLTHTKPRPAAPASLRSSAASERGPGNDHEDHTGRGVNELLADLRRASLASHQQTESQSVVGAPSVPPAIRHLLRLPETPPPAPRRPAQARFAPNGTRLPPGPPPPRSWLSPSAVASSSRPSSGGENEEGFQRHALPGAYLPSRGSLVELALRGLASDWEFQRLYNRYYLYPLSSRLKTALITYLGMCHAGGVSLADLQAILLPIPEAEAYLGGSEANDDDKPDGDGNSWEFAALPSPSSMNEDMLHLDLTGSLGRSIKLRELASLLFPPQSDNGDDVRESWDSAAAATAETIPRPLLPNLTHLSLAVAPQSAPSASWRQLLSFATRLPALTHLSLAYWPEPTLTPNARFTSVVPAGAQGRAATAASVSYGGTGPYSHSLDGDWSEATLLLRRLARSLYQLEYLDLTGCGAWFPALMATEGHDTVDWVGDWGKISTLLLYPGYDAPGPSSKPSERARFIDTIDVGHRVERHIRVRRAGRGRLIQVETDPKPEGSWTASIPE